MRKPSGSIVSTVVFEDPSRQLLVKHRDLSLTRARFSSFPAAALIRGNRNNCTQFSNNLDWLVSKLERLESSSGMLHHSHTDRASFEAAL